MKSSSNEPTGNRNQNGLFKVRTFRSNKTRDWFDFYTNRRSEIEQFTYVTHVLAGTRKRKTENWTIPFAGESWTTPTGNEWTLLNSTEILEIKVWELGQKPFRSLNFKIFPQLSGQIWCKDCCRAARRRRQKPDVSSGWKQMKTGKEWEVKCQKSAEIGNERVKKAIMIWVICARNVIEMGKVWKDQNIRKAPDISHFTKIRRRRDS